MRVRGRLRACAFGLGYVGVVVAAVGASPALALWDGKLTPFVEEKVIRDDNVFRLSKNVDPVAAIGSASPGDTYTTTSLGITLDAPLSRQRFQAGYTWSATRYNQFSDLDFNGHDARAVWLWQLGNDLSGQLGYAENLALAPFQYTQTRTPDPLRSRTAFLNGAYLLTPRWRVQAGGSVFSQTNGAPTPQAGAPVPQCNDINNTAPAFQCNDINISSADASLSYVTPGNNSIGVSGRVEEGRYPNRTFVAGSPFDDSYRQASAGLVGDWTVSGVSHLAGRVARLSRRYPNTPQSDFDGNIAVLEYDWKVTGKLTLTGVVRRDISPFQDIQSSFVLVRGATVRPTLSVTEKIELSAILDYSIWDYLGDPGLVAGGALGREDRVRSGTASLSYKPLKSITLQASVMREKRTSNLATADYLVNVGSLTARLSF